jgi:hypothetical protein
VALLRLTIATITVIAGEITAVIGYEYNPERLGDTKEPTNKDLDKKLKPCK